eukprot:gene18735-25266_t
MSKSSEKMKHLLRKSLGMSGRLSAPVLSPIDKDSAGGPATSCSSGSDGTGPLGKTMSVELLAHASAPDLQPFPPTSPLTRAKTPKSLAVGLETQGSCPVLYTSPYGSLTRTKTPKSLLVNTNLEAQASGSEFTLSPNSPAPSIGSKTPRGSMVNGGVSEPQLGSGDLALLSPNAAFNRLKTPMRSRSIRRDGLSPTGSTIDIPVFSLLPLPDCLQSPGSLAPSPPAKERSLVLSSPRASPSCSKLRWGLEGPASSHPPGGPRRMVDATPIRTPASPEISQKSESIRMGSRQSLSRLGPETCIRNTRRASDVVSMSADVFPKSSDTISRPSDVVSRSSDLVPRSSDAISSHAPPPVRAGLRGQPSRSSSSLSLNKLTPPGAEKGTDMPSRMSTSHYVNISNRADPQASLLNSMLYHVECQYLNMSIS